MLVPSDLLYLTTVISTTSPKWMDATEEIVPNFGAVVHITTIFDSKSDGTSMFLYQIWLVPFFGLNKNDHLVEQG